MTISTTTVRLDYAGDDTTTTFPYTFKIFANTDLRVILTVDSTGVPTTKTLTTHYTVSGVGEDTFGNVEMITAPATGETLSIIGTITNTQTTDLVNETSFFQDRIEDRLDRLCRADQLALAGYIATLRPGLGVVQWTSGTGTPEGAVSARVGSLYTRVDGGASTTLYVKESGTGNTGWVAK